MEGDLRLVHALTEGLWDLPANAADFAVLHPGERLAPSYQDDVFRILPPEA